MDSTSSSSSFIGYFILSVIHRLYTVFILVYCIYDYFLRKTYFFIYEVILPSEVKNRINKIKLLNKIPKHLAVVLGNENIFYSDLVKFISWSNHFGISYLSFYHHKNCIDPAALYENFFKYNKESARKITWGSSFNELKEHIKVDLNGHTKVDPSEQLHVNILSKKDSLNIIVDVTKGLCKSNCSSSSTAIGVEEIDDIIRKNIQIPDVDVAVVFGKVNTSYGFPPWFIRITEFMFLPTNNISSYDFIHILEKYNKCEQRYGK